MKPFKFLFLLAGLLAAAAQGQTTDSAPASLSSVIFNGTITSSTGSASKAGTFSSLLSSNGLDYTLSPSGALSDPTAFTYTKTGANTASVTEPATGAIPSASVALTFTNNSTGTFVATYGNASTQTGSFTLVPIGIASALVNVSTRTVLAANGSALTGFIVAGSMPRRVLIRAVGPGLGQFNVSSTLTNPQLTLRSGATVIGTNDDYDAGTTIDSTLKQQFAQVGAFALTAGSRDAALIATLAPGAYTVQIRGGTDTEAGEVLMEVYFLD